MSGERDETKLSDGAPLAEFETELKLALAVSPSPGFEQRVLRRVPERTAARSHSWVVYTALPTAAAVVIVTALAVQEIREGREHASTAAPPAVSLESATTEAGPKAMLLPAAPARPAAALQAAGRSGRIVAGAAVDGPRSTAGASREPEVIVPPGQGEAIRRFLEAMAEGTLEPPRPVETDGIGAPAPMRVQPLTIEPILVSAAENRGGPAPVVRPQQRSAP
jgi:hypothetical protein